MKLAITLSVCLPLLAAGANVANLPPQLQGIGIDQKLNAQAPLHTEFINEDGQRVPLGTYFGHGPVLLALVYYTCPMLCSQILEGVVSGLKPLSLKPGRDFNVVAISFDPRDTPAEARQKRQQYSRDYAKQGGTAGWNFLTGTPDSIRAITEAVGFHYRWDPKSQMFIHASGVMVLTPEGKIARYFYGVDYSPNDLQLGLVDASHGKIGSLVDQVLLFCYHYDPSTGKYSADVLRLLRAAGLLVLLILVVTLTKLWRRDIAEGRRVMEREARRL